MLDTTPLNRPAAPPAAGRPSGASTDPAACYHCGLPVPASAPGAWTVRIDDTDRAMCCPGCAAVAQAIVDLGQQSYYRDRSGFAATAAQPGQHIAWSVSSMRTVQAPGAEAGTGRPQW